MGVRVMAAHHCALVAGDHVIDEQTIAAPERASPRSLSGAPKINFIWCPATAMYGDGYS
jgi:hypothetical protein